MINYVINSEKAKQDKLENLIRDTDKEYTALLEDLRGLTSTIYLEKGDENKLSYLALLTLLSKSEKDKLINDITFNNNILDNSKISVLDEINLYTTQYTNNIINRLENGILDVFKDISQQAVDEIKYIKTGIREFNTYKELLGVLKYKWTGFDFKEKINIIKSEFIRNVVSKITLNSVMKGDFKTLLDILSKEIDKLQNRINLLIRTEGNFVYNQMKLITIRKSKTEEYKFVAIMDERTTFICRELNGNVFKVQDATIGVNFPPMHPNCRSTIIPFTGDDNGK